MNVQVKLYAVLQRGRFEERIFSFPVATTVGEVVDSLELPPEHVDILLVNGVHVDRARPLREGDVLSILPMVEGG